MSSDQSPDQVVALGFPPSSRFLSAARLVATSLGADAGLTVDDLDDLRLGVNELVTTLRDALSILLTEGADAAAVVDADGASLGSLTLGAIRHRLAARADQPGAG